MKQVALVRQFYSTPSKKGKEVTKKGKQSQGKNINEKTSDDKSDTDSEYMPGDSCTSGDDDEASQIFRKFKDFKKKLRRGDAASLDDVIFEGCSPRSEAAVGEDDGNCTPYADSSDNNSVDELGGQGQSSKSGSMYPRFNKKNLVVKFELGMKFSSKKQFKKVVIKHGLDERKVIRFALDDPKRVRAKCDWEGCPWVCLLSKTSRSDSWQISTFTNNHVST